MTTESSMIRSATSKVPGSNLTITRARPSVSHPILDNEGWRAEPVLGALLILSTAIPLYAGCHAPDSQSGAKARTVAKRMRNFDRQMRRRAQE